MWNPRAAVPDPYREPEITGRLYARHNDHLVRRDHSQVTGLADALCQAVHDRQGRIVQIARRCARHAEREQLVAEDIALARAS